MKNTKNRKMKKAIYITLLSLLGLMILSGVTAYFLIHNYISKMNLITIESVSDVEKAEADDSDDQEVSSDSGTINIFSSEAAAKDSEGSSDSLKGDSQQSDALSNAGGNFLPDTTLESAGDEQTVDVFNEIDEESATKIAFLDQSISDNLNSDTTLMEDPDVLNILLIGSDTRNTGEAGRSDSMIIVTINEKKKKIVATSFLRDIYLSIPGRDNNRLNTAYAYGGAELLLEVLQNNFKFKIDKYIMVDFYAFIDIVDAIGGIELEVSENELETINMYIREINQLEGEDPEADILTDAGSLLINGKQALGYARNRYSANGDFDRTSRQREVLMAIYEKAKDQDLLEMNHFLNVILPQITTNFAESEILTHLLKLPTYFDYGVEQWCVPVSGSYRNLKVRGMAVLGIDFDLNIRHIYEKLYSEK